MTEENTQAEVIDPTFHGAVIAGIMPGQQPRVVREAAKYAGLLGVKLVIAHVDVSRFVAYNDPDTYLLSSALDLAGQASEAELEAVRGEVAEALKDSATEWTVHQLVGDPAFAIKKLSEEIDAPLIVVGTRERGVGETIRQFFTGSVAARLSHRQNRSILVVPLGDAVPDSKPVFEGEAL